MYIHMQTLSNVIYGKFVLFFASLGIWQSWFDLCGFVSLNRSYVA